MAEFIFIISALSAHLWYLFHTTFVDWPEMLLYPWFLDKGLLYYRDVVLAYVPGAYYVLYPLYKLLGFTPWSERLIAYGLILLTDVLVYLVARKLTQDIWKALASLAFFILWQPIFSGNTIWYETILAPVYLISFFSALRYLDAPNVRHALYLGLCLAAASLIKQTAVWIIAVTAVLLWSRYSLIIGLIPLLANLLVWGYFALLGAGKEYVFWTYGFLSSLTRPESSYMLLPSRSDLTLIIPAFLPLLAMVFWRKKRHESLLLMWSAALLMAGLPRWGLHRLQPLLAFAAVGFGTILSRRFWTIALLSVVLFCSVRSFRVFTRLRDPMQPQFFGKEYLHLVDFAKEHLDKPYYVLGNYDYLYYGLSDRPSVLPWVPLFPWNAKVPGMQERIIVALEERQTPYVLFIPYHGERYYRDYRPEALLLYIEGNYEKIQPLPVAGGWLYQRK